jgi:hypothetical protein
VTQSAIRWPGIHALSLGCVAHVVASSSRIDEVVCRFVVISSAPSGCYRESTRTTEPGLRSLTKISRFSQPGSRDVVEAALPVVMSTTVERSTR